MTEDILYNIHNSASQYLQEILSTIDGIKVVSETQIKEQDTLYPQGNFHRNLEYLLVQPSDNENKEAFFDAVSQFRKLTPDTLESVLQFTPCRHSPRFVFEVSISPFAVDSTNDCVDLSFLREGGSATEILSKIESDVETLMGAEDMFEVESITSESQATVRIHKDLVSMGDQNSVKEMRTDAITKYAHKQYPTSFTDPYYTFDVENFPSQERLGDLRQRYFNRKEFYDFSIDCPSCGGSGTVSKGFSTMYRCTECGDIRYSFVRLNFEHSLGEIISGKWSEASHGRIPPQTLDPEKTEMFTVEDVDVYDMRNTLVGEETYYVAATDGALLFKLGDSNVQSFGRRSQPGDCFYCGESAHTVYEVEIQNDIADSDKLAYYAEKIYICSSCEESEVPSVTPIWNQISGRIMVDNI